MSFFNSLEKFVLGSVRIDNEERLGIPVGVTVLFDSERFTVKKGFGGTPVMIYVINTKAKRVGTLSDLEIVTGMLGRGYVVAVLDYLDSELAQAGYMLDLSVQAIRQKIMKGEIFASFSALGSGKYPETLVVPSGCDASYGNVYWQFDKHGSDGTLEKIVEIWNNDFRGTKGEILIKWTDKNGVRKATQSALDGSTPVWCNEQGDPDENGSYIRVKHTLARDVTDCVKPDASMIDLKLYMHIVYPTAPESKVPVMCLAGSSENLCSGSATADRPHMNGFVFNGYAGIMFDYGYTPMARNDHYGYFDGYPKAGYITGDNPTYSLKFYNARSDTAAMRYIRYLALSEGDKYRFDTDAIGVYGNSKGGWTTYIGETDPDAMPSIRMFKGHHDETRYDNDDTASRDGVCGGELQPWLTYNGEKISGRANLVYSSCGAAWFGVTKGHSPLFVSCNRRDESCFSTSNSLANLGRILDIPTMCLEIPLPHTIAYGEDLHYGIDSYGALFDCAGYHLRGDAVKALGIKVNKYLFPASVTVLFSGTVTEDEASKLTLTDKDGVTLKTALTSQYGGCEWTLTPDSPIYGDGYKLNVPASLRGANGKVTEKERSFDVSFCQSGDDNRFLAFEVLDGVNSVGAYTDAGECVGRVNVSGKGWYKIALNGFDGDISKLTLKAEKTLASECACAPLTLGNMAMGENAFAPDGTPSVRLDGFKTVTTFPTEEFYSNPTLAVKSGAVAKEEALDEADVGRRFKISFRIYDTVSRYVTFGLNHCSSRTESIADYFRVMSNARTRKDEWTEYSLDYTVYEPLNGEFGKQKKSFYISCYGTGNEQSPVFFADLKCEEIVTPVKLGRILSVSESDEKPLRYGLSEIVCPKAPWSK